MLATYASAERLDRAGQVLCAIAAAVPVLLF